MTVQNEIGIARQNHTEATTPLRGPNEPRRSHLWIFLLILVIGYVYVWRRRALDWA